MIVDDSTYKGDEEIYMSESERQNETMKFPVMVNVMHALGFIRWNYPQLMAELSRVKASGLDTGRQSLRNARSSVQPTQ